MSENMLVHSYGLCERTNDHYLAEPLNAFTSIGFFITAFLIFRYYKRHPDLQGFRIYDIHILTFLIFCIGIGSTAFHMFPNRITELMDIVPIVLFINIFFLSSMFRIVKCKKFETVICYIAFAGFTHFLVTQFPKALNDSIGYLSSMTALIVIAFYLNIKHRVTARAFMAAALLGVVSLFFRSIDNEVCSMLPIGTHFLWHSLNATLLYILMLQLIRNVNRRARMLRAASIHFA